MANRTRSVRIRFTDAELAELDRLVAERGGASRSRYIRRLIRLDRQHRRWFGS